MMLKRQIPCKILKKKMTLLLSEKVLAADWNKPEEDKAWASLQQKGEYCSYIPSIALR